jgi:DNA-binding NtrC family response regulator
MTSSVILVVEDDPLQRKLIAENLAADGHAVFPAATASEAVEIAGREPIEVAIVDYKLGTDSGIDVVRAVLGRNPLIAPVMATAFGSIETAVEAMKAGAFDFIVKPIDVPRLRLVIERARERHRLQSEVSLLRSTLGERYSFKNLVFASPRMEAVARLTAKAAASDVTVLITGETGTGKDLIARTIHFTSRRRDGPFLAVNLPAIPETLLESELFGAEKGAYTGAHERKTGKFEAAAGGTLLLDEIGDLPAPLQVKILRFLQEREFTRLGSTKVIRSDARIVAATNRDLERLVAEGEFRADLFYRLDVVRIPVPPLRERREDIPLLVDHFLKTIAAREKKAVRGISAEAMAVLARYRYPGNIRELENIIERALVFAEEEVVTTADLPVHLTERKEEDLEAAGLPLDEKVRRLEVREIRRALEASGGVKAKAARALGITERMLGYKVKVYGLK